MDKIIVFGATGGTGKHVVEQALGKGYKVTAIVRKPENFLLKNKNLKIIKGDVLEPNTFLDAMHGNDAVISCLGIPKIQQTTLYSEGIKNIVKVMQENGMKRIICISSGAIDIPPKSSFIMTFLLKNVLQRIYKPIYSDMKIMEDILNNSFLNWTVVRAPKLTDGKHTRKYRDVTKQALRNIPKISRADLADFMVYNLCNEKTYHKKLEIAY